MDSSLVDVDVDGLERAVEGNRRLSKQHSCRYEEVKRRHGGDRREKRLNQQAVVQIQTISRDHWPEMMNRDEERSNVAETGRARGYGCLCRSLFLYAQTPRRPAGHHCCLHISYP